MTRLGPTRILGHVDIKPAGRFNTIFGKHVPEQRPVKPVGAVKLQHIHRLPRHIQNRNLCAGRQICKQNLMLSSRIVQSLTLVGIGLHLNLQGAR